LIENVKMGWISIAGAMEEYSFGGIGLFVEVEPTPRIEN
jgi:hypothetical protein